jgi:hypothetical protein
LAQSGGIRPNRLDIRARRWCGRIARRGPDACKRRGGKLAGRSKCHRRKAARVLRRFRKPVPALRRRSHRRPRGPSLPLVSRGLARSLVSDRPDGFRLSCSLRASSSSSSGLSAAPSVRRFPRASSTARNSSSPTWEAFASADPRESLAGRSRSFDRRVRGRWRFIGRSASPPLRALACLGGSRRRSAHAAFDGCLRRLHGHRSDSLDGSCRRLARAWSVSRANNLSPRA